MAEVFARSTGARAPSCKALSLDHPSVSLPVLEFFPPLLIVPDLVDIIATGNCENAMRHCPPQHLAGSVLCAIAEFGTARGSAGADRHAYAELAPIFLGSQRSSATAISPRSRNHAGAGRICPPRRGCTGANGRITWRSSRSPTA